MRQRISTPDGIRLIDLGAQRAVPLPGYSHRGHAVPGGSLARPLPAPEPEDRHRAESLARYARAYRARQRGAS